MSETESRDPSFEATLMRRISKRLLPFLMLVYFISYVDRVNMASLR